MDTQNS